MRRVQRDVVCAGLVLLLGPAIVRAGFNLELRQAQPNPRAVGQFADQDLYAIWDGNGSGTLSALDLMFSWDPAYLQLDGSDDSFTEVALLGSFFPTVAGSINDASPPTTGQGHLSVWISVGATQPISTTGTLLTTLLFTAVHPTPAAPIELLPSIGTSFTHVYDGEVPGLTVDGTLSGSTVVIVPEPGASALLAAAVLTVLARRRRPE